MLTTLFRLTYQLLDAKAQDPGDMDQWAREFNNFASSTLMELQQRAGGWLEPWQTMMLEKIGELISPAWEEFRTKHKDDPDPWGFLPARGELLLKKENVSLRLGRENGRLTGCLFDNRQGEGATYFRFDWSPEEDAEQATISPIKVTGLACVHPSPMWRKAAPMLAKDVLDVLRWTHDPQQLQDKLASIFYDLSHTSTFHRGARRSRRR